MKLGTLSAALLLALVGPAALAQDAVHARSLAATCANCHGTNGVATGVMAPLAGLSKDYILGQMKAFKDGTRTATIMHQIAKGYTDEQLQLMAGYFANQKR
jgi:cytochrome subunit of sulfide dehydrogenase